MSSPSRKSKPGTWCGLPSRGLFLLLLGACHPQAAPDRPPHSEGVQPPASPGAGETFISLDALATTPQGLLGFAPARARSTLVIFQAEQLYRQLARLERVLSLSPRGKELVGRLHRYGELSPVPIPWTSQDLERWGISLKRPLIGFLGEGAVALLPLAHKALFKKSAELLLKARWSEHQRRGVKLETLAAPRPMTCHFSTRWALCGTEGDHVVEALRQTPAPSLWSALTPQEKERAGQIAALYSFKDEQTEGTITATLHGDGLGLQLRLDGLPSSSPLTFMSSSSRPSTLLGLALGAQWVIRAQYNMEQLKLLTPQMLLGFALLGLDGVLLAKSLTGEVLLYQRAPGELALVAACSNPRSSQQVVEALGGYLQKQTAKGNPDPGLPSLKIRRRTLNGAVAFNIQATLGRKLQRQRDALWRGLPFPMSFGLAAGPLGVVLGSWPLVEAFSRTRSPSAGTFLSSLATEEDRGTFGDKTGLSFLGAVGDPLIPLAAELKTILSHNPDGEALHTKIELGRLLLDQLHRLSMSYRIVDQHSLRVRLRLTTLHRDQIPSDDVAQELWLKGLQAKYEGAMEPFWRALADLRQRFSSTRFGALGDRFRRGKPQLTGATLVAARVLPTILEGLRRPWAAEIHPNLARIVSAAKFSHDPRKGFPRTTPWTPARSCCKSGGVCAAAPGGWGHATWKALRFSIDEDHRYQYRFVGGKRKFTAEARGDLNCDGVSSSFSIVGTLQKDGSVSLSAMDSTRPLE